MAHTYKTFTLGECAKFDWDNKLSSKLSAWAKVSNARREKGISKKAIRLKKQVKN